MKNLWSWVKRVRFELLVLAACLLFVGLVGLPQLDLQVLVYKILLLTIAVLFVHFSRQYLFPDLGLWRLLTGVGEYGRIDPVIRAAAILGLLIFMGLVISAFMSGL